MALRLTFSLRRLLVAVSLCCLGMGDVVVCRPTLGQILAGMPAETIVPICVVFSVGAFFGCAAGVLARRPVLGAVGGGLLTITATAIIVVLSLLVKLANGPNC